MTRSEVPWQAIKDQQRWIADCIANGVSYAGERGENARREDMKVLMDLRESHKRSILERNLMSRCGCHSRYGRQNRKSWLQKDQNHC